MSRSMRLKGFFEPGSFVCRQIVPDKDTVSKGL